jgi:hypothetical protein
MRLKSVASSSTKISLYISREFLSVLTRLSRFCLLPLFVQILPLTFQVSLSSSLKWTPLPLPPCSFTAPNCFLFSLNGSHNLLYEIFRHQQFSLYSQYFFSHSIKYFNFLLTIITAFCKVSGLTKVNLPLHLTKYNAMKTHSLLH